jgi:hypothetical protein
MPPLGQTGLVSVAEQQREDVAYLREQAERCFRLARTITDKEAIEKLTKFGEDFLARADEVAVRVNGVLDQVKKDTDEPKG